MLLNIAPEIHIAFRGLELSLLARKERSLWRPTGRGSERRCHRTGRSQPFLLFSVFAFPQESTCISSASFDSPSDQAPPKEEKPKTEPKKRGRKPKAEREQWLGAFLPESEHPFLSLSIPL